MIELTSDPLSEAARQGCATLRELAGRTQAIIVLDRYLWDERHAAVHSGALCDEGLALFLDEGRQRHVSRVLSDAALDASGDDPSCGPRTLCPECRERGDAMLASVADVGLYRVKWGGVLSAVYLGDEHALDDVKRRVEVARS